MFPPPPPSLYYLLFIANGIYRISGLATVKLPASAGTCQNYNPAVVSQAFGANFTLTGRTAISRVEQIIGAPQLRWWEFLDKRNGRYIRIFEGDRIEVKFADGSRVKLKFNGPYAAIRFEPIHGTERLPNGARLFTRQCRSGTKKCGGSIVIQVTPTLWTFAWHWSITGDAVVML